MQLPLARHISARSIARLGTRSQGSPTSALFTSPPPARFAASRRRIARATWPATCARWCPPTASGATTSPARSRSSCDRASRRCAPRSTATTTAPTGSAAAQLQRKLAPDLRARRPGHPRRRSAGRAEPLLLSLRPIARPQHVPLAERLAARIAAALTAASHASSRLRSAARHARQGRTIRRRMASRD